MKTSESIKEITGALITFHEEMNNIPKTGNNPFFNSKYVTLDKILTAIKKPLKKANLTFVQFPIGENELETRLLHESGEWMGSSFKMQPTKKDPQAYGSVITYQRRYALSSILGLNTDEDDDGNDASKEVKEKEELTTSHKHWDYTVKRVKEGVKIEEIKKIFKLSEENTQELILQSKI